MTLHRLARGRAGLRRGSLFPPDCRTQGCRSLRAAQLTSPDPAQSLSPHARARPCSRARLVRVPVPGRKDRSMLATDVDVGHAADAAPTLRASSTTSASRSRPSTARAARRPTSCCCAPSSRWACRCRARTCSRRTSPACRRGTRSAPTSTATSARKKEIDFLVAMNPETAREDVLALEPGAAVRLRRAAEARRAARRSGLLPGAVRQARRAGLHRRQAAAARAQHDLRRRAGAAARHRPRGDATGAAQAARQEAEGARAQRGGARGRLRVRRPSTSRSATRSRRADERDRAARS